jgi:hypothetical protein
MDILEDYLIVIVQKYQDHTLVEDYDVAFISNRKSTEIT